MDRRSQARTVPVIEILVALGALALSACGGSAGQNAPPPDGVCRGGSRDGQPCTDLGSNGTGCPDGICFAGTQSTQLQNDEVTAIMNLAASTFDQDMVVAVTDRRGVVLGVGTNFALDYDAECNGGACPAVETGCPAEPTPVSDCRAVDLALQLARTAAFFSADQTPLTSRSVRFLSGEHFPPGIANAAAAALFGIENTNRGCSFDAGRDPLALLIPRAVSLPAVLRQRRGEALLRCEASDDPDAHCGCTTGIATIPGAVPIFRNNSMSGGIGVVFRHVQIQCDPVAALRQPGGSTSILRVADNNPDFAQMEFAAHAFGGGICRSQPGVKPACCNDSPPSCATFNIIPQPLPDPGVIFVDGIEIPEVGNPSLPRGVGTFGGITTFIVDPATLNPDDPLDSAQPLPIGWLVPPTASAAGMLSASDVQDVVFNAYGEASKVRAAIRLPLQARTQMMLGISDLDDVLLGLFRMNDATVFSIDVAVAKSRNVAWFSNPDVDPLDITDCPDPTDCGRLDFPLGTAVTNRTISFGAQPFFPSGIDDTIPGPFRSTFIYDSANVCTNGHEPANGRQNGIVFFPGSAPLYEDGALVGGFGVSGDGVEQDDLVTFGGVNESPKFVPRAAIRADQYSVRGVRLPYLKFNRQPFQ